MGSEVYANPPTWNFPVQACDSNYITLKQIRIIDTLVAKFRKAHNATPRHDTFKTPGQASPNPRNFGDTWKYLCSIQHATAATDITSTANVDEFQKKVFQPYLFDPLKWFR